MKIIYENKPYEFYKPRPGIKKLCEIIPSENRCILIEVGSLAGFSTEIFSESFKKVVSIDPYLSGYDKDDNNSLEMRLKAAKNHFKNNVLKKNNVEQHNVNSSEGAKLFEDGSVDVVFIDGCHTYKCVKNDINVWYPKLKKGGYLIGDDYNRDDVKKAVDEVFGKEKKLIGHGKFLKIKN